MRIALLMATALAGCIMSDDGDAGGRSMVVDSAGVVIVTSSAGAWNADEGWRVDPQPSLVIGAVDGAPEYLFSNVLYTARLADSTIVVADDVSRELRYYDGHGRHVRTVGGEGDGPGEFRGFGRVQRFRGDSLLIWDSQLRRASVFTPDGSFVRSLPGPVLESGTYAAQGVFADGSLLFSTDATRPARDGAVRATPVGDVPGDAATFFRYSADGIDTLGTFFMAEKYVDPDGRVLTLPFGRRAAYAAAGDRFHYGTSDAYEIGTWSSRGQLQRVLRSTRTRTELRQADIDARVDALVYADDNEVRQRDVRQAYATVPYPRELPAYGRFLEDADGNLWVQDYAVTFEDTPPWTVFDADGRLQGVVELPTGLRLSEIGGDYVLGKVADELEVERVVMHRLIKAAH